MSIGSRPAAHPAHDPAAGPFGDWLDRLAAPVPDPGGGAAAGVVIAIGAALVSMTAGYAAGSPEREGIVGAAAQARAQALQAAAEDAEMSATLVAAFRQPTSDPSRSARILAASLEAAIASERLAQIAAALLEPLRWLQRCGEPRLAPDVAVAARMLACGMRAAAVNLRCDATSAADAGASVADIAQLRAAQARTCDIAGELEALAGDVTQTL
ncbi:MAG: cyclodeaminase/cyclohydrolase family protein [Microbacterium sp.]